MSSGFKGIFSGFGLKSTPYPRFNTPHHDQIKLDTINRMTETMSANLRKHTESLEKHNKTLDTQLEKLDILRKKREEK